MRLIVRFSMILCCLYFNAALAQEHGQHYPYVVPEDEAVREKLADWKNLKFGLFMHWGTYSQWGVVESWSLCPEDEGWCVRRGPYAHDWFTYKKAYENLQTTFNPVKFNPEKWAEAAKAAGMGYVVFTTKHHDGFCMFDTRQTDYRITHPATPFSTHPKANITKEIFDAFRTKGFMTGAYFSKPDWHTPDYWWKYFPPKDRNVSYDPAKYPERWQAFKDFTYRQIEELARDYGRLDILWLDGGWVRPKNTIDTTVSWQKTIPYDQDIDMPRIASMARRYQPGMLIVDRTVAGPYENYVTPEQTIPDRYLPYPWESCITLGTSWSYVPNDKYKSAREVIHMLTSIISRNGSLLLNIGPGPDGEWDENAYKSLEGIARWMQVNAEAIHQTNADESLPQKGPWVFTRKNNLVYAIYQAKAEETLQPAVAIPLRLPEKVATVSLLGQKPALKFKQNETNLEISIPGKMAASTTKSEAWVFKIELSSN
ncbi:MAG: alpha-L-fucosidase [Chitinophagaceae bacterium]|nr:alpha-L-fucosidase [Chitinophagaceae bacterium]